MKVPPASTNRSRMANDVASSVRLPISMAPRLRTETERWVAASVPIVRYLINRVSEIENALSQTEEPGHRAPDPGRVQPMERSVLRRRPVPAQLTQWYAHAEQPVRPRGQRGRHGMRRRPGQRRLEQHNS